MLTDTSPTWWASLRSMIFAHLHCCCFLLFYVLSLSLVFRQHISRRGNDHHHPLIQTHPFLMQTLARGESRRKPQTSDPTRRRRTPSVSPVPSPPRFAHLSSLLQSLTYFVATAPSLPLILLALPITFFATLFVLPFRPSFHAVRITFRTPHLLVLTTLHLSHILTTLLAIRLIGPVRALISLGAHPTIAHALSPHPHSRRPRSLACIVLTLVALSLLAYDVSVDAPAARMRDRVLRTSAGRAVHDRLQNISNRININSLPFRHRRRTENPPEPPLPETNLDQPNPPVDPPPPPKIPPGGNTTNTIGIRRRLMAIVKGEHLISVEHSKAEEPGYITQKNDSVGAVGKNDSQSVSNASDDKANSNQPPTQADTKHVSSHENGETSDSLPHASVSRLVAAFGVLMGCSASVTGRVATEMRDRVMGDAGDWSAVSVALFSSCSLVLLSILCATSIVAMTQGETIFTELFAHALPRGIVLSLAWLVVPVLIQVHGKGLLRRTRAQRVPKVGNPVSIMALCSSVFGIDSSAPTLLSFYVAVVFTLILSRVASFPMTSEVVGALTYLAGALLVISSKVVVSKSESSMSRRVMTGSSGDLSVHLSKGSIAKLRSLWLSCRSSVSASLKGFKDLVVHARSNKASWQVLNFLILQSIMAVVELIYATVTNSSGLFSISADNFFCSVALAIGLIAIRMSSRKPSPTFSYGYGRVESLCGFANGIILIYVGVLVILEAFERSNEDAAVAIGRAYSVCLLGLVGNLLGLYFFPPESRRENHNVQGIYLHIWANTIAFARIAMSTGIVTAIPKWKSVDMVSAAIVGFGMVISAIPLVVRSGRLLLLIPPLEKEKSLFSMKSRLDELSGVDEISALRVWNLTPNCLVASVRIKVSRRYEGGDAEILSRARAVFTLIGIPPAQCTIQITRVEDNPPESVVYLHKRSRSSLPDTGINVDMLPTSVKPKTEFVEGGSSPAVLTL